MKPKKTKCCEKCSWTKSGMCLKKSCECHCPDKQTKCKNPMCGKRLNDTDQTMFCPIHRPDISKKDEGEKHDFNGKELAKEILKVRPAPASEEEKCLDKNCKGVVFPHIEGGHVHSPHPAPKGEWKNKLADLIDLEADECTRTHEPNCHANEIIDYVSQLLSKREEYVVGECKKILDDAQRFHKEELAEREKEWEEQLERIFGDLYEGFSAGDSDPPFDSFEAGAIKALNLAKIALLTASNKHK